MNSRWCRDNSQNGFSLLEVLVAFSILALAVGSILSLFASGLRNTVVASEYARALTLAESHMAMLVGGGGLESGDRNGAAEGFTWHSRIYPYDDAVSNVHRTRLYRIDVSVNWGKGAHQRSVHLSTLQMGRVP